MFIAAFVKETKGLNATELMNLYRPEQYKLEALRETTTTEHSLSDLSGMVSDDD